MKNKLTFLFGSHCHQPVGNFDSVFESAASDAYEPFFDALAADGYVRMSAHFSGPLLEWLEINRPRLLGVLAGLVQEGRLEMMGGGFYEPVLAAIPAGDRRGQLEMMNGFIKKHFSQETNGAWMTERVWEPQVVSDLLATGMRYVVIDDYHFKIAGIREDQIDGYYMTETDGRPLAVFPISEALRYTIPFEAPEKTIEVLRKKYDEGKRLAVMMDDGEKFGVWPGTRKLIYKEGWLKRFFNALQENSDWLQLGTPTEVLNSMEPSGVVYLPTASYFEMSEWTLPADMAGELNAITHELQDSDQLERFRPFLRGGIWRNFFTKYPEANNMHKRMLALSRRLEALQDIAAGDHRKEARLGTARRELYKGQCNCAYWHGVFGGLYLPHLRDAVYRHLIIAENAADYVEFGDQPPTPLALEDRALAGPEHLVMRSETLNAAFTPGYGGALYELDYRPLHFNLLNTLASRKEGYHAAMLQQADGAGAASDTPSIHDIQRSADESMRKALHYDWHHRYSFLDHLLPVDTTLTQMRQRQFKEGGDFVNQPWTLDASGDQVTLTRHGGYYDGGVQHPVTISKSPSLSADSLQMAYRIINRGEGPLRLLFAPECNFSMLGGADDQISYVCREDGLRRPRMQSHGVIKAAHEMTIEDLRRRMSITVTADREAGFWFYPSQTVSQSEQGFELNYQSSVILPFFRLDLMPDEEQRITLTLEIKPDTRQNR